MTTTCDTSLTATFEIMSPGNDLGPALFLREGARRGHLHVVERDVKRTVTDDALPPRARLIRTVDASPRRDVLAEVDDVLVLLRAWRSEASVWTSAADAGAAVAVAQEVLGRAPAATDERRVEVVFSDGDTGSRTLTLNVRPWLEIAPLYPGTVRAALDVLAVHEHTDDEARRLLLWHGEPGTGKTSAVRGLLHSWRGWADGLVVSDPERLLTDGKYLRRLLLDVEDEDRWQLVVLEDAEALLSKPSGSSAMGKLLNLADGLLGQGLRCLFLLTTNEPLARLSPALVRPGRCLARVEFGPLSPGEASAAVGRRVDRPTRLADLLAAPPLAVEAPPVAVGQYL